MPKWLEDAFHQEAHLGVAVLIFRLLAALGLGCVVAGIYRLTNDRKNGQALSLMATLVMLTVLIAMVTLVIGESQARAFSLVGALAIIRFRTVVEDTRDTAFVIFAVAVGMGAGTGYLTVTLIGLPIAATAAYLFRPRPEPPPPPEPQDFSLTVRVGLGRAPEALLAEAFGKHLERSRLIATSTARQGASLELIYSVRLRQADGALPLVTELNGIDGIQGVELRRG